LGKPRTSLYRNASSIENQKHITWLMNSGGIDYDIDGFPENLPLSAAN